MFTGYTIPTFGGYAGWTLAGALLIPSAGQLERQLGISESQFHNGCSSGVLYPMNPSVQIEGYWVVSGTEFSPSAAERITQVIFSEKSEPGEICARGRYRGKPAPEGWAKRDFSVPPEDADLVSSNSEVLATLERCLPGYRTAGAKEIILHFNVSYSSQCNLQLTAPLIRRLANLGVDVTLTCFAADQP